LTGFAEHLVEPLRPDHVVKLQGKNEVVMIVEYKRCGYIRYGEFEDAMYDEDEIEEARDSMKKTGRITTLNNRSNALVFVKQTTAYHQKTGCRYVALCDYDGLVLLQFRGGKDLNSVYATTVLRLVFRKALLQFLLEACLDVDTDRDEVNSRRVMACWVNSEYVQDARE
jgi:hypothetical protein